MDNEINGGELSAEQMARGDRFTELVDSGVPFEEAKATVEMEYGVELEDVGTMETPVEETTEEVVEETPIAE